MGNRLGNFLSNISPIGLSLNKRSVSIQDPMASQNLFGEIASRMAAVSTQMGFIPTDGNGAILDLSGNIQPQWKGLNHPAMQYWAYGYCSPLAAVVDRIAEASSNGRIDFYDDKGNSLDKQKINKVPHLKRIRKLLLKPNPWQTWEEFTIQQIVYANIYGYCPVYFVTPEAMDRSYTKSIFNLNPFFAQPVVNTDFDHYGTDNPIKEWRVNIMGSNATIDSKDILLIKDGTIDNQIPNLGLPMSKVAGLDFAVSNICAAMEADNVLLKKKGPLGVFSFDPKADVGGWQPMTPTDKDDLQKELSRYGMSWHQLQYIISKQPIKWNAMSFNLRDLMTKETIRQGTDSICDRYNYPAELMSGKNATYENRASAERHLYQNNIIPSSLRRMALLNEWFGLDNMGYELYLDFDHVPCLQEDALSAGNARKARSESLQLDWINGLITWNEYRYLSDLDKQEGMDIYYPEWMEKFGKTLIKINTKKSTNEKGDSETDK